MCSVQLLSALALSAMLFVVMSVQWSVHTRTRTCSKSIQHSTSSLLPHISPHLNLFSASAAQKDFFSSLVDFVCVQRHILTRNRQSLRLLLYNSKARTKNQEKDEHVQRTQEGTLTRGER